MTDEQKLKEIRERKVRMFVEAVVAAALLDAEEGIAEYEPRNSRKKLVVRLNLTAHRTTPRKGDGKYARSIYTAVRWLLTTETDQV